MPPGRPGQPVVPRWQRQGPIPKISRCRSGARVGIGGCKVLRRLPELDVSRLLASFYAYGAGRAGQELSFVIGPENPDFVPFEQLAVLVNSIMTTEDHGFFASPWLHRSGVSIGTSRTWSAASGWGASSITMQWSKTCCFARNPCRASFQEMFLTWYVENYLTEEIRTW